GGRGARAVSLGAGHQEPHADTRWLWCMSGAADSVGPLPRVRGRVREGACNKARAEGRWPLPTPPTEVGFIRLRPVKKRPNSGKLEFGLQAGEGADRVCRTVITSPRFKPHIASPFVPAKAGTQSFLNSRFRGNERSLDAKLRFKCSTITSHRREEIGAGGEFELARGLGAEARGSGSGAVALRLQHFAAVGFCDQAAEREAARGDGGVPRDRRAAGAFEHGKKGALGAQRRRGRGVA